jgi:hypothetical protein
VADQTPIPSGIVAGIREANVVPVVRAGQATWIDVSWRPASGRQRAVCAFVDCDQVDQLLNDAVTVNGATQHQYSYAYD